MLELWYQPSHVSPRYKLGFEFTDNDSGRLQADVFAMVVFEVMERLGHERPIVRVQPQGLHGASTDHLADILSDALVSESESLPNNISFFPTGRRALRQ